MAFKFAILACIVAAASAGLLPAAPVTYHAAPVAYQSAPVAYQSAPVAYAAPVAKAVALEAVDPHPRYSFSYDVQDGLTGDSKTQHETRDGDVVQGSYSVVEPDGTRRIVDYTADPHHGFNAVVRREPAGHVVKAAPVAYSAAPVVHQAPLTYSAPVYHH